MDNRQKIWLGCLIIFLVVLATHWYQRPAIPGINVSATALLVVTVCLIIVTPRLMAAIGNWLLKKQQQGGMQALAKDI